MKMYDAQKAKGLLIKLKYKKFQASISQWDVMIQKDLWYPNLIDCVMCVGV